MEYQEIIDKIQERGLYDFICNYYWQLDKEDLRDIAKELLYNYLYEEKKFSLEDFIERLKDLWEI